MILDFHLVMLCLNLLGLFSQVFEIKWIISDLYYSADLGELAIGESIIKHLRNIPPLALFIC